MKIEYRLPGRLALTPRAFTTELAGEPPGGAPRLARLVALAQKLEGLIRAGTVKDYAEVARLGHVSTARVSQIMLLWYLAPVIQEQVLFLSAGEAASLSERELRNIAREPRWDRQRERFDRLVRTGIPQADLDKSDSKRTP
jgi:hypothetical protein